MSPKTNGSISLLLLNVQSIRNKTDELLIFLESHNFPNLVLITEHWLKTDEPCFLPNYLTLSLYSRKDSIHGGTLILISERFSDEMTFINVDKFNHLLIEREFEFSLVHNSKNKLYILCMYRPPSSSVTVFIERLEMLLSMLPTHSTIILCGDLNINFNDKCSVDTQNLQNLLTSFNLAMHVNSFTRISQYSESVIDYVCSNLTQENVLCSVVNSGLSDHEAVLCNLSLKVEKAKSSHKCGRIYSKMNYDRFFEYCQNTNWENILNFSNQLDNFHNLLTRNFCKAFKLQKIKIKSKKLWITRGIKTSARNLRSLHYIRKYISSNFFLAYFNRYRGIYRMVIKCAKKTYYENRLQKAINTAKESWAIVNDLRGKTDRLVSVHPNITPNNFNEYYCSIAAKLTENIAPQQNPLDYLKNVNVLDNFELEPVTLDELKQTIRELKNKNSSGIDDMSIKVFATLPVRALAVLVQAINESFITGLFPPNLKKAIVIPLHKGGEVDDPSNFRPISLLTTLSKIIEKLMKKRIVKFLDEHNILLKNQFGFQNSKNTTDAILEFLEKNYLQLNEGEAVGAVFCDFSKAFDTVNHDILLQKLWCYGFRGVSFSWIKSYLSQRTQVVKTFGEISDVADISCGVPQGSVLGPILFLLYINDLATIDIQGTFTLFADDTTILWHNKNVNSLRDTIKSDICKVKQWCDSNLLVFNTNKTNILTFKFAYDDLFLDNQHIKNNSHTKFLGLYIDEKLKFDVHVVNLCKRLASGCYAVRITSNELGFLAAKTAYFSLIESHIRYGIPFWGSCSQQLLSSVFILQKRALRYMCKSKPRDHCKPLFVTHKILTLSCIFILETVCLVHKKIINSVNSDSLPKHNTRLKLSLALPLPIPRSTLTKQSVIYESKKIYNHIPLSVRSITNLKTFREAVKGILIQKAYYNIREFYSDSF